MRIVQESLTNIMKHADASRFEVKLLFERHGVQVQIRDDGKGFDPALEYDGFGLIGMTERARRIGRELTIASSPGRGTKIRIALQSVQIEALQA
jgi:signal transduction histidine kinase